MTILIMGKIAIAKAAFGALLLTNSVTEPHSMAAANELLLKRDFDLILYGVDTNIDDTHVRKAYIGKTEVFYVAEKFNGCCTERLTAEKGQ